MSIRDFAKHMYFKTFDSGETNRMGSFRVQKSGELVYIRSLFYVRGMLSGTEKFRIKIFSDSEYKNVLYTSAWSKFQFSNWLGWIRADFFGENVNKTIDYFAACEISGYSRAGDTFYIAQAFDFPWPVYDNEEKMFHLHPLAMQIFCRVSRQ